jgi:hypothetical protein
MAQRRIQFVSICFLSVACGLIPERVARDDERLAPLWAAIAAVDREALGFTEIDPNAEIRLEGKQLGGDDYDAMLHISGVTSRTISFRKVGEAYKWTGEQETHTGRDSYTTVDGTFKESITVTYETEPVSGSPLNSVSVRYSGEDPRLAHRLELTLEDVLPILQEWRAKP